MAIYTTSDSYTKLLIHSDDPDGSSFIDSSQSPHTITRGGDAYHKATTKVFGSSSIELDGGDDRLSIPHSSDFDFSTGDFTIDFWIHPLDLSGTYRGLINHRQDGAGWEIKSNSAKKIIWYNSEDATERISTNVISTGEWYHIAVVNNGGSLAMYINGSSEVTWSHSDHGSHSKVLYIGEENNIGSFLYDGYMDEIRISKGIARWASNFTPPNKPYDIINTETQTLDSKEDSAFGITGGGNAQFGSNIITSSDPEASVGDSIFTLNRNEGIGIVDVFEGGTVRQGNALTGYIETRVYPLLGGTQNNVTIEPLQLDANAMYEIIYASQNYAGNQTTDGWRFLRWHGYDGSGEGGEGGGVNHHIILIENSGTGESTDVPVWDINGINARFTYGGGYASYRCLTIRSYAGYTDFRDI